MTPQIKVGDRVLETMMDGRQLEHEVLAVDLPPRNPDADPGPYIRLSDAKRDLLVKPEDIENESWLEHVPASSQAS